MTGPPAGFPGCSSSIVYGHAQPPTICARPGRAEYNPWSAPPLKDACPGRDRRLLRQRRRAGAGGGLATDQPRRPHPAGGPDRAVQRRRAPARPQPEAALDPAGADPGLHRLGPPRARGRLPARRLGWPKEGKSSTRRTSGRAWRTPRGPSGTCSGARTSANSSAGWATIRRGRGWGTDMGHADQLRAHLLDLLGGGHAHLHFDQAVAGLPPELRGAKPAGVPHTPWRLLEHLRIAHEDILRFCIDPRHVSPEFSAGYWPAGDAPPDPGAWDRTVAAFRADLKAMMDL